MAKKSARGKFQKAMCRLLMDYYHQSLSESVKRGIRAAKLRKEQELCKIVSPKSR